MEWTTPTCFAAFQTVLAFHRCSSVFLVIGLTQPKKQVTAKGAKRARNAMEIGAWAFGPQSRDARLAARGAGMPVLEGRQARPTRGGGSKAVRRSRARRAIRVFRGLVIPGGGKPIIRPC